MALGDYTRTTYVNGTAPALSATNLNNSESKIDELDKGQAGVVSMYAGSTAPSGWLLCNGQAVSRSTYSRLFTAIGTTWGSGDGSTTFNVPDIVGAAPAGVGTSTGYTQNETYALGTKYNDQEQLHRHQLLSGGGSTLAIQNLSISAGGTGVATLVGGADTLRASVFEEYSGGGTPRTGTVTRGKRVGINFIIKY